MCLASVAKLLIFSDIAGLVMRNLNIGDEAKSPDIYSSSVEQSGHGTRRPAAPLPRGINLVNVCPWAAASRVYM